MIEDRSDYKIQVYKVKGKKCYMINWQNKNNKMRGSQRKSVMSVQSLKKPVQTKQELPKTGRSSQKQDRQNPERQNSKQSRVSMQLIFQANKEYLMDKIAISQVPKPSKYYHKLPSKTPSTTYNNQFHKINPNAINQIKFERKDNIFTDKNVVSNYQSLYSQNFNHNAKLTAPNSRKQDQKTREKPKYEPNDSPAFLQTSYSRNFNGNNYNPVPAQSAKMKELTLMGGGKFKGETTYHELFKGHNQKRQHPIHQTNNKIFLTIDTPKETTYEKQFNSMNRSKVSKQKTLQSTVQSSERKRSSSQTMSTQEKNKFKSEYERSFQTIHTGTITRGKNTSIMSMQQMKNLLLNVI